MKNSFRIVLAQLNFTVGDVAGNLQKHIDAAITARDKLKAKMIIFSELSISGYPPEDLLLRKNFLDAVAVALKTLKEKVHGIYCLVGHPQRYHTQLFNAASLFYNGKRLICYFKQCLPNCGVFDECRYFTSGLKTSIFSLEGIPTGIIICEDLWKVHPLKAAAENGARLIACLNASPFEIDKHETRATLLAKRAKKHNLAILYVNQVGGQDELVFDGGSMAMSPEGKMAASSPFFEEALLPVEVQDEAGTVKIVHGMPLQLPSKIKRIYEALVLGLRDYIEKNNFPSVVLGLSGGIDSALTLAIAVDALSKERVHAVMMPSAFTAEISMEDSAKLIENLGVNSEIISIETIYQHFLQLLSSNFAGTKSGIAEENIQARCRAILLMAISNKHSHLLLTTGNRSELAVGYCTLYGDMAGGFAVLKDVPKTLVWQLAAYRNEVNSVIPQRIITRPPSAELAANQKDEDSLGAYENLDKILYAYLNQGKSAVDIIADGFDAIQVNNTIALIHRSEYKRRQAAIGTRINHQSFVKDWRYPISSGWKA